MRSSWIRVALVCALLIGAPHSTARGAKAMTCAETVSAGDAVGLLVGEKKVTRQYGGEGDYPIIIDVIRVGYYAFANGVTLEIVCDSNTLYQV